MSYYIFKPVLVLSYMVGGKPVVLAVSKLLTARMTLKTMQMNYRYINK